MTDNQLIALAQKGDVSAMEQLFNRYKTFVMLLARNFYLVGGDTDDLVQEGMMAFYKAINTFDCARNVNFKNYARTVVTRHLINIVKSANSNKYSPLNDRIKLNEQGELETTDGVFQLDSLTPNPEVDVLSEENVKMTLNKINAVLSEYERNIFDLYMQGYSYVDIATKLGVSNKSVDNALNRIKTKLQFIKE